MLNTLGTIMRADSRPGDVIYRSGGEEFIMMLPETPVEVALAVAERMREQIKKENCPVSAPSPSQWGWPFGRLMTRQ